MAAPFKVKSEVVSVLHKVYYQDRLKFVSTCAKSASREFKRVRPKLKYKGLLRLVRVTTVTEQLIVP